MSIYRPAIFTDSYIESKNVLSLCLEKHLSFGSNITNYINNFLKEYASGFALFKYKEYVIKYTKNNIKKSKIIEKIDGHPFEVLIRILSKFRKNTSNETFNQILKNINNIPNYQQIDLMECINFIVKKSNRMVKDLIQLSDFSFWLYLINEDIAKLNINRSCKTISYIQNTNGKYIQKNEISYKIYYIDGKLDTLEEYIIKRSRLTAYKKYNTQVIISYEQHLIINDDIIYLDLTRYAITFTMDNPVNFIYNKLRIPYILDLPDSVFENNEKYLYELISVILFDNIEKKYSSIIKEGDKYYHYLYEEIIECNEQYFYEKTADNAIGLFYRKL